jgi:hypothetical protein
MHLANSSSSPGRRAAARPGDPAEGSTAILRRIAGTSPAMTSFMINFGI